MSRNLQQRFSVYRGHHGAAADPDETQVATTSWTPSLAAADVYAREPSVDGMAPEKPIVSHRIYNAERPAIFDQEEINVDYELGEIMGFDPDEVTYVKETYGEKAKIWEIMNDKVVRNAFEKAGADVVIHPETFTGVPRFGEPEPQIMTLRDLGANHGATNQEPLYQQESIFGEGTEVAAKWQAKLVKEALMPDPPAEVDPVRWKNAVQYLLPKETELFNSAQGAKKFAAILDELPTVQQMGAAALEGAAKKGWYRKSADALYELFGADTRRFTHTMAALSPQTSVESNLRNTLNLWINWERAGRPQTWDEIQAIVDRSVEGEKGAESVLPAWRDNIFYALTEDKPEQLSGAKVSSFAANLLKEAERVTNDAWMAHFADVDPNALGAQNLAGDPPTGALMKWGPKQKLGRGGAEVWDWVPKGKGQAGMDYLAMTARVRQTADFLTEVTGSSWSPMEVQETVWSWTKALYQEGGRTTPTKLSDLEEVNRKLSDDIIRDVPDFGQLLSGANEYSAIIEEAGYARPTAGSGRRSPAGKITAEAERAFGEGGRAERTAENIRRIEDRRRRIRQGGAIERLRFENPGDNILKPRRGGRGYEEVRYDQGTSGEDVGRPRVLGTTPVKSYQPTDDFGRDYANTGGVAPVMHQVSAPQAFHDRVSRVATIRPSVYAYSAEEYADMRTFITEDGSAGFAIKPDGDIVSVFNEPGSPHKGAGHPMIRLAVELGGTKLDCFDIGLPELYSQNGFKIVGTAPWDPKYAPAGWQDDPHLSQKPDVVFMVYDEKFHARPKKGLRNELEAQRKRDAKK